MSETFPFSIPAGNNLVPASSGTQNLGSTALPFSGVYAGVFYQSGVALTQYTDVLARAVISGLAPIVVSTGLVSISSGSASVNGYISSGDWTVFNGKQASGNYVTSGSTTTLNNLTITGTLVSPGEAKKYILFSGVASNIATTPMVSVGVTSVTRSFQGIYDVVFSGNFADINYMYSINCNTDGASYGWGCLTATGKKTTSGCQIGFYNGVALFDPKDATAMFYHL